VISSSLSWTSPILSSHQFDEIDTVEDLMVLERKRLEKRTGL
jgi:hypothetical protein